MSETSNNENTRFWIKLVLQPILFLALIVLLIVGLGVAQRLGFLTIGDGAGRGQTAADGTPARYICAMMCTPPQDAPGRCPVCAMDLVVATSNSGPTGAIDIEPAARRISGIQTAKVQATHVHRTIKAVGELNYDEGSLRTISAYVDGRLDRLYADFVGFDVKKSDDLALVYSPQLYTAQVEFLLARKSRQSAQSSTIEPIVKSAQGLYRNTRQRLVELGMTKDQITSLEQSGEANSRLHLHSPISGTVIEKLANEGDYVKEGQPIYRLADLSAVWLSLKLFPEDAATIRYGQRVNAEVQSLPGTTFMGRVAFVDRNVDPQTRTVGVRVVIPNVDDKLRVGDYAKAHIQVPLNNVVDKRAIYDPELADKWISPRHPHVVEPQPGKCRVCGVTLVAAASLGFTAKPVVDAKALIVPRAAVLTAGDDSIVYVEVKQGRFEARRVRLGRGNGESLSIVKGLEEGETVAVRGNFLLDSQSQLAGNPSLIDPSKVKVERIDEEELKIRTALAGLSDEDRKRAGKQRICPVAGYRLGSMGTPKKVDVNGQIVFICCQGCYGELLKKPKLYLAKLKQEAASPSHEDASNSQPEVAREKSGEVLR